MLLKESIIRSEGNKFLSIQAISKHLVIFKYCIAFVTQSRSFLSQLSVTGDESGFYIFQPVHIPVNAKVPSWYASLSGAAESVMVKIISFVVTPTRRSDFYLFSRHSFSFSSIPLYVLINSGKCLLTNPPGEL